MSTQVLPVGSQDPPQAATINYVAQAVDPQTGAATVRFTCAAVPEATLLGMSVDLNISVARIPAAITIPREAVGSDDGRAFALVVVDGRAERRAITIEDWPASGRPDRGGRRRAGPDRGARWGLRSSSRSAT